MKKIIAVFVALFGLAAQAHANAYYIPEQGAKAMGMGNAFTAVADDASAIWFNPAGIAFQDGFVTTLGTDLVMPTNKYTVGGMTYTAKKTTHVVPHGYVTYKPADLPVAFGIGINAPFGLSTDWTNSGAPFTSPIFGTAAVTFSRINMFNVNPTVAFQVNDSFAIAVGADFYDVYKTDLNMPTLNLTGKGTGWGFNAALLYRSDMFNAGISYRSHIRTKLNGTATTAVGPVVNNAISTALDFPEMVNVGVAFRPVEQLLLSFDVDWTNWKKAKAVNINFAPGLIGGPAGATLPLALNWGTSTIFRAGVQWDVSPTLRTRLGYVFDPTPTNSNNFTPRLPDNDRQLVTAGLGYDFSDTVTLDLAYAYVWLKNRMQQTAAIPATFYNGLYKSHIHLVSGSLTLRY